MELFFLALLFILVATALSSGYPVAFALSGASILTILLAAGSGWVFAGDSSAFFHEAGPRQWLSSGVGQSRFYWTPARDTLIAIPLFIFMGVTLQRSKIAEDLLVTMAQLFGSAPGGLGVSVVFVGALLAATTGIVGATVVAMGLIALPAMMRHGYANSLSTGAIAASGTLGQIIPPSIVLIILADQLSNAIDQAQRIRTERYEAATGASVMPSEFQVVSASAGDMFMGAFLPGMVLVGLYIAYILITALLNPKRAPSVPREGAFDAAFLVKVLQALAPPLLLIVLVLGSIIGGFATVNQAGAVGAAGALAMASYKLAEGRRDAYWPAALFAASGVLLLWADQTFDVSIRNLQTDSDVLGAVIAAIGTIGFLGGLMWSANRLFRIDDTLQGIMSETARTSALVFVILIGAALLTAAFRGFGGERLVEESLGAVPGGFWTQFLVVMVVIFLLGFFLDFIEIAVVVVPIVAPILLADPSANVAAVWLGVMVAMNIQTSFLTPPFGFALFYLRGVAPPSVGTLEIYRGVIPFIGLQLLALAVVAAAPPLANYLPLRVALTAETAPPPQNPRLQYCLERFMGREFAENGAAIQTALQAVRSADFSALPKKRRGDLEKAFDQAAEAFPAHAAIGAAEAARLEAADDFRPLHTDVRAIERRIRWDERRIETLRREARLTLDEAERAAALREIETLEAEIAELRNEISEEWAEASKAYRALDQAESRARKLYRRTVDRAAEPVLDMIAMLESVEAMAALRPQLAELGDAFDDPDPKAAGERFRTVSAAFRAIPEVSKLRSALSRARRELRRRTPKIEKARDAYGEALEIYDQELAWRSAASGAALPALTAYRDAIADTIAVRALGELPRRHALYIAGCQANHRDISLSF